MRKAVWMLMLFLGITNFALAEESRTISASGASESLANRQVSGGQTNASAGADMPTYVMGACEVVPNRDVNPSGVSNGLNPNHAALQFLLLKGASITSVLQQPKHGRLVHKLTEADNPDGGAYWYIPEENYRGPDGATFLVDFGNTKAKIVYVFHVTDDSYISDYEWSRFCNLTYWNISSPPITSNPSPTTADGGAYIVAKEIEGRLKQPEGKLKAVKHKFFAGEVVRVTETNGDEALVVFDPNAPERVAWVPRSALVGASDFHPVKTWDGARSAHWSAEDYDSGIEYTISTDGTFRAYYDDNRSPRHWTGRIYRSGNIIWLRGKATGFDDMSIFILNASGALWQAGPGE